MIRVLRPGEALALRWGDVRERTILVERAVSLGEIRTTKTRAVRSVKLLAPLGADLKEWYLASARPDPDSIVFPRADGGIWTEGDWKNWRRRAFRTAVAAAGLARSIRPYDLRHAFCSLLIAEGRSIVEVASQMGHAPTMSLDTYAHLIAELDGAERIDPATLIAHARETAASVCTGRTPDPAYSSIDGKESVASKQAL